MSLPFRPFVISSIRLPENANVTEVVRESIVSMLNIIARQIARDVALHNVNITPIGMDEFLITVIAEASSSPVIVGSKGANNG